MDYKFDNERPIYIQLVEKLRIAILSSKYELGSKLPSVRDLALITKTNPNTIQKALNELENEGLIYTERTNGKYVTTDKKTVLKAKEKLAKNITSKYLADMEKIGVSLEDTVTYLKSIGGKK